MIVRVVCKEATICMSRSQPLSDVILHLPDQIVQPFFEMKGSLMLNLLPWKFPVTGRPSLDRR